MNRNTFPGMLMAVALSAGCSGAPDDAPRRRILDDHPQDPDACALACDTIYDCGAQLRYEGESLTRSACTSGCIEEGYAREAACVNRAGDCSETGFEVCFAGTDLSVEGDVAPPGDTPPPPSSCDVGSCDGCLGSDCATNVCRGAIEKCGDSSECLSLLDCVSSCGTDACFDACATSHSARAADLLDAAYRCLLDTACPTDCGAAGGA